MLRIVLLFGCQPFLRHRSHFRNFLIKHLSENINFLIEWHFLLLDVKLSSYLMSAFTSSSRPLSKLPDTVRVIIYEIKRLIPCLIWNLFIFSRLLLADFYPPKPSPFPSQKCSAVAQWCISIKTILSTENLEKRGESKGEKRRWGKKATFLWSKPSPPLWFIWTTSPENLG